MEKMQNLSAADSIFSVGERVMETSKRKTPENQLYENEEYATRGPFASIFGGPVARLLDQALIVGKMEQTIAILADSTNLSYKTTKEALVKLIKMGFVTPTRKLGTRRLISSRLRCT
jgi:hypothetical protein